MADITWILPCAYTFPQQLLSLNLCPSRTFVYDGIGCAFHGGRITNEKITLDTIHTYTKKFNQKGIGCRLTFSNYNINQNDLDDPIGNQSLSILNNYSTMLYEYYGIRNGVITSSDLLYNHVKLNYPYIDIISSILKPVYDVGLGNDNITYYNKLLEVYDYVVVNSSYRNNYEFLKSLSSPHKAEFIINHECIENCRLAKYHYDLFNKISSEKDPESLDKLFSDLSLLNARCSKLRLTHKTDSVTRSELTHLLSLGFNNFKIQGRNLSWSEVQRSILEWVHY